MSVLQKKDNANFIFAENPLLNDQFNDRRKIEFDLIEQWLLCK